jgi:hypothetical protein
MISFDHFPDENGQTPSPAAKTKHSFSRTLVIEKYLLALSPTWLY